MSRPFLITGGGGFVGQWLAKSLLRRGDDVTLAGLGERPASPSILTPDEWRRIRWIACDIRRAADVEALLSEATADVVVHLAGVSFVPDAERDPAAAYAVNLVGGLHVAAGLARRRTDQGGNPLLLVVGSGTQYGGHGPEEMPLEETAEQRPLSVYAATKAAQEIAVLQVGRASGLRVICTRSFNHSGIGHAEGFVIPSLVKRVRAMGSGGRLSIGNDVVRDFLHVDDVVEAYLALIDRGRAGEAYNVCSGAGISTRHLAETVVSRAGSRAQVVVEAGLQRAADMPVLIGSPRKLMESTGWAPKKSYTDIVDDLLAAS